MNKQKVAEELFNIAKSLVAGGEFSEAEKAMKPILKKLK